MIIKNSLIVSKEFKNFVNFFIQKTKILSIYDFHDHVIYIKKECIIFYNFLYNLFIIELIAQKSYIEKQLQTNMI